MNNKQNFMLQNTKKRLDVKGPTVYLPTWEYSGACQVNDLIWLDVLAKINNTECWLEICSPNAAK